MSSTSTPWEDPAYYREISPITYADADPDAAADPALGAGHPHDDRPGRGAVHGPALAAPAGPAAARARGDPRADALGHAVPARREPRHRRGLVPPLPRRRQARPAAAPQGPRRPLAGPRHRGRRAPSGSRGGCILARPMTADPAPRHRRPRARERAHRAPGTGARARSGSLLGRVTAVDQVGVEERVDALKRRSIKKASKLWALDLAIRMMDLTTLEGKDTPGKVRALCVKAMRPQPGRPDHPARSPRSASTRRSSPTPRTRCAARRVKVASVATGFPSGQTFRDIKIAETRAAVEAGADEIDMVIDRGAFLSGDYADRVRGDRRGQGGGRRGAPQGHPRDRRARDVRQRPARERPRDGRRRRLHQDLDRQGARRPRRCRSRW